MSPDWSTWDAQFVAVFLLANTKPTDRALTGWGPIPQLSDDRPWTDRKGVPRRREIIMRYRNRPDVRRCASGERPSFR